jgi:hypothetical protein
VCVSVTVSLGGAVLGSVVVSTGLTVHESVYCQAPPG